MNQTSIKRQLLALTASAVFCAQFIVSLSPVRASILAGCVGTDDTAVSGVVGWVDVGVMLGTEAAQAPELTTVVAPDGTTTNFRDGDGLIPPTDEMPIWFAPVDQLGGYTVITDGEECAAVVTAQSEAITVDRAELVSGVVGSWVSRSAPVSGK
jgi:hypothetical protein